MKFEEECQQNYLYTQNALVSETQEKMLEEIKERYFINFFLFKNTK
jgi:hypothetical protein